MQPSHRAAEEAANAFAGLLCCGGILVIPLALIIANVFILIWVAKDAKARGMDGAMWLILVFFTGIIGLLVYMASRPQGALKRCRNCGNSRMEVALRCPHCGASRRRRGAREEEEDNEPDDEPIDDSDDESDDDQGHFTSRPSPAPVIHCPYCGVRLRLPPPAPGKRQKFVCSSCMKPVDLDANR